MCIVTNDPIPANKIKLFLEILGTTGGRLTSNPLKIGDTYRVDYKAGDYKKQLELWNRFNTPIKEVDNFVWWRVILRKFKIKA